MDRLDQAVSLLKESISNGKSTYESRQLLFQNGFTEIEIDDAMDKLDEQNTSEAAGRPISNEQLTEQSTRQVNATNLMQPNDSVAKNSYLSWYVGFRTKAFTILVTFILVFVAGNFYSKHHSTIRLVLYFAALGLSAVTTIYLNLILNIRGTTGIQRSITLAVGLIASFICLFFLWFISIPVLR